MITTMNNKEMNPITAFDRDVRRFQKYRRDRKMTCLFYGVTEGERTIRFSENGHTERVLHMELDYIDANGTNHIIRSDESNLCGVWIFIFPDGRTLMVYGLNDKEPARYCSWGYKNSVQLQKNCMCSGKRRTTATCFIWKHNIRSIASS